MSTHLLLIDALNLIRRIYAVDSQQSGDNSEQAAKNTYFRVLNACRKLIKATNATHAVAVFDGDISWRYHYYPQYKQARKPMPETLAKALPELYKAFSEVKITVYVPKNDEADDVIATLATKARSNDIAATIVSTDKGFLPLLSTFTFVYDYFKSEYLTEEFVYQRFELKPKQLADFWALNGDKTNDIPGVAGIGKQGALKLLHHFKSVDNALKSETIPNELSRIFNKLNSGKSDYIRAKLLVSLRQDIDLGFSLKNLRLTG